MNKYVSYSLILRTCLPLALVVLVTSCCPPIWSKMKKRADAELAANAAKSNQSVLALDNFRNGNQNWLAEAEKDYTLFYSEVDSSLDINTSSGLTLWYKAPFEGDLRIKYEFSFLSRNDSLDEIRGFDCFWMASDPMYPDSLNARMEFRKGASGHYYSLQLYCMSIGNSDGTTCFRRYDGNYDEYHNEMKRPDVLAENTDQSHLIRPNHWYTVEVMVHHGCVSYIQDGDILVNYVDPSPLKKGWFGIRTAVSHMRIRNFVAYKL